MFVLVTISLAAPDGTEGTRAEESEHTRRVGKFRAEGKLRPEKGREDRRSSLRGTLM